jgi:hypothetical protein
VQPTTSAPAPSAPAPSRNRRRVGIWDMM